ncbi:MAG: hypothetical protein JSV88_19525 [Candidatus Aminicenantes bacterium]|nr:MAG: hypothetical protein JSV88_19525 [Candidatus Aminicenantes bacterium]
MKKMTLFIILFGLSFQGFSIVPGYYGARSLSLGYASTAFNYDINSIFLNPAILSTINYTLYGYQYQQSYMDYKNFAQDLSEVLEYNLKDFENLGQSDKTILFSNLKELFQSKVGISGFRSNLPGYITRNFGLSFSVINTAIVNPVNPGGDFFDQAVENVSNADIASLEMNFIGLKYKKISLSYSMDFHKSFSLGITLNYLNGKVTEFKGTLVDDIFTADAECKDYLEYSWDSAEDKFSKMVADAGIVVNLGKFFNVGLVYRNFGAAKINTPERQIALSKRVIAGLAFKPNMQWGIYVDMDLKKSDLLYNGQDMQPITLGIEKGFFNNKFFVRLGMLNDLTEKDLFGKKSNALYGLGIGFNMGRFAVDAAIGIDVHGTVKNLAVSGFILMK